MGGDESGSDTVTENGNALTIPDNLMRNIVYGLAVIAAGFVVFLLGNSLYYGCYSISDLPSFL